MSAALEKHQIVTLPLSCLLSLEALPLLSFWLAFHSVVLKDTDTTRYGVYRLDEMV